MTILYETDFYAWTQHTASLLREEEFEVVDWDNLIEEIEGLGSSQQNEVENRLIVLIMHLLKWHYQAGKRGASWRKTISIQRIDLARLLRKNPSLRTRLPEFVDDTYLDAVKKAVIETGFNKRVFPTACPYSVGQIMDEEFWPEA